MTDRSLAAGWLRKAMIMTCQDRIARLSRELREAQQALTDLGGALCDYCREQCKGKCLASRTARECG